jgi:N-acetylmuramoyl-L-alanine amidase
MSRQIAKLITLLALLWLPQAQAAVAINSARIWPAQDYTRLTLETSKPLSYKMFTVDNPSRLVVDLDNVKLRGPLETLTKKVGNDDPNLKSIRVGQFKPGVVRLVLDLKAAVKPQLFSLKPVANYGYRLVLDVYPETPADPLMALVDSKTGTVGSPAIPSASDKTASMVAKAPTQTETLPTAKVAQSQPQLSARKLIVVIDAGHGGEDPGAHGRHGTLEKNVTLAIARKLRKLVDDSDDMRAVMTRNGDYFIPLHMRVVKARRAHADLFVSIHADSYIRSSARGSSVFALSEHGATSAAARWLAKNENEADLIGGVNIDTRDPYLARTLLDLSQTATISDSLKLGKFVLGQLGDINNLHRGYVEQAGFAVLKAPDIPSILVETAFISNPSGERHLRNPRFQKKIARAIFDGIKRYFAQNPPLARPKIAQAN